MSNYNLLEQHIQNKKFSEVKTYFNKNGDQHGLSKKELNSLLIKSVTLLINDSSQNYFFYDDEGEEELDAEALVEACSMFIKNGADYTAHAGKTKRSARLNSLVLRVNPGLNSKLQALHDRNLMRSNYKEEIKAAKPVRKRLF